jgi:hypothetical protein
MFLEGNVAHPVRCDSPLQIKMAVWRTFFEFELAGLGVTARCRVMAVWCALNLKKVPNGHYFLQRAVTPYLITLKNCLQRAGGPKRQ